MPCHLPEPVDVIDPRRSFTHRDPLHGQAASPEAARAMAASHMTNGLRSLASSPWVQVGLAAITEVDCPSLETDVLAEFGLVVTGAGMPCD